MYITILFQTSSGIIRASALVDSGCYAMFIDQDFANKHRIKYPKPATSSGCAVDGTRLSYSGQGTHKICAYDHNNRLSRNRFNFQVLKNCPDVVVLGMPFLNKINPQIDWVKKTWHLPEQKATKPVKLIESEHMAEQKTIEPLQTIEPAKMTETKRKILVPKPRMLKLAVSNRGLKPNGRQHSQKWLFQKLRQHLLRLREKGGFKRRILNGCRKIRGDVENERQLVGMVGN